MFVPENPLGPRWWLSVGVFHRLRLSQQRLQRGALDNAERRFSGGSLLHTPPRNRLSHPRGCLDRKLGIRIPKPPTNPKVGPTFRNTLWVRGVHGLSLTHHSHFPFLQTSTQETLGRHAQSEVGRWGKQTADGGKRQPGQGRLDTNFLLHLTVLQSEWGEGRSARKKRPRFFPCRIVCGRGTSTYTWSVSFVCCRSPGEDDLPVLLVIAGTFSKIAAQRLGSSDHGLHQNG